MDGDEALEKIGVGSAVILAGFVVGAILEYLVKVVLARFLGPESYGVFIQGIAVVQVAAVIALFGLHKGIPRFMSYYRGRGEEEMITASVTTTLYLVIPSSIVATVVLYAASGWLSLSVFGEPALVEPLRVLSLGIVPLSLFYLTIAFMRGMQNARHKVYIDDVVLPVTELLLILAFFVLGYGVMGAVYAYLMALVVTVVAGYHFYRRLYNLELSASNLIPGKLIRFSWPLLVVSIFLIMGKWIDVLMLGWLKESLQVGVYEVAFAISGVLILPSSALAYMFMPVVSELYGKGNIDEILGVYRTTARWIFTIALPLLAGMLVFPSEILTVLFGSSYTPGTVSLMLLAVGYFYQAGTGLPATILVASDRTEQFMISLAISISTNLLLNLILIPRYGIVGAAVSTTVALLIWNTILLLFAWREVEGFPYNREFLRIIPAILVASVTVYLIKSILEPGILFSVVLGVLLVVVYIVLLYLFGGIQEEDHSMLERLLESVRER